MDDSASFPASGPVLLCVDLQPVFLNAVVDRDTLLRRCAFAIESARGLDIPVVFSEQAPQKLGGTSPDLLALAPGAPQLSKGSFSVLGDDGLRDKLLKELGADHFLLLGIETPVCIYQTAIDAIRSQIPVTLLADCLGCRRPEDGRIALEALARSGAHVLPSESVFYSMLGDLSHPFFRSFTQLVKKYA